MSQTVCPICRNPKPTLWCKATDEEYHSTGSEEFTYFHCDRCSCLFIGDMPTDRLAQIYPANYYSFRPIKKNLALRIKEALDKRLFASLLAKLSGTSLSVLDIGGGTGWLLGIIRQIDPRVTYTQVVDIDEGAQSEALLAGHHYFRGTIEAYQPDRLYDLVLMLNLIEHVADPKATLAKVGALLKPGGIALIKTPNIESWDARIFRRTYWGGLHAPRHWVLFSEKSFRLALEGTGLQITDLKYTQGAPFWTWSVLAWMHRRKWIVISAQRPAIYHPLATGLQMLFAALDFLRSLMGQKTSQMFIVLGNR